MCKAEQTQAVTLLYKLGGRLGALLVLTPEIMELCQQASVEQDTRRLMHLVSEINRLIAVHRRQLASNCEREPEYRDADF